MGEYKTFVTAALPSTKPYLEQLDLECWVAVFYKICNYPK